MILRLFGREAAAQQSKSKGATSTKEGQREHEEQADEYYLGIFRNYDENGDNTLSLKELEKAMRKLGIPIDKKTLLEIFASYDYNSE